MEKRSTSLFQALNWETRARTVSAGERPRKKQGATNFFLATRDCSLRLQAETPFTDVA
jgi:hypothetical protein